MKKALWIIAMATVVRVIQNAVQLHMLISEKEQRKRLNNELVDSLRDDNKTWLYNTIKELDEIIQKEDKAPGFQKPNGKYCDNCKYAKVELKDEPCNVCFNEDKWEPKEN